MDKIRKPFQGTCNIIRFNWHFYLLSLSSFVVLLLLSNTMNRPTNKVCIVLAILVIASTVISLAVSFYVYDLSNLYTLTWLDRISFKDNSKIVNISAGFDETSRLLKSKFSNSELLVFDFYDPTKHTEVSIERARKAYPPFSNTLQISTSHLPLKNNLVDKIFITLSAHEIRYDIERVSFFKELYRVLNSTGQIIVTEHLRDTANFLAYNIGVFHFHSKATWIKTFQLSGFRIVNEIKITPFITTFILEKNGKTS